MTALLARVALALFRGLLTLHAASRANTPAFQGLPRWPEEEMEPLARRPRFSLSLAASSEPLRSKCLETSMPLSDFGWRLRRHCDGVASALLTESLMSSVARVKTLRGSTQLKAALARR